MPRFTRTALAATAAALTVGAPAAHAATPKPGYSQFKGCPNTPAISACQTATINGGYFKLGKKTVPITKAIKLTGGVSYVGDKALLIYETGGGLKSDPIKVPGGLSGLTGLGEFFLNLFTFGSNDVYATPELAGAPEVTPEGLNLPLRIKLKNNLLASSCAIGSTASPVWLKLTTGTTTPPAGFTPLTGDPGTTTFDGDKSIINVTGVKYVDNTFAVAGATGCGNLFGFDINPVVNSTIGLPAGPGASEAVQSNTSIQIAFDLTKVF